jgi:hypothetical protein
MSATTAVMMIVARDDSQVGSLYGGLIPSHSANLAGIILYAIAWVYHTVVGIYYKQWWFFMTWFIGCGLETAGYIGRFNSSTDITNMDDFLDQIICLTLAPAFFMGGVYYLLAKLAMVYGPEFSLLKPMHYSLVFIICDLISIVIQAAGGGIAAIAVENNDDTTPGTHVMVAGMAFQVFSMVIFILLFGHFMYRVYTNKGKRQFNPVYTHLPNFLSACYRLPFHGVFCVFLSDVFTE